MPNRLPFKNNVGSILGLVFGWLSLAAGVQPNGNFVAGPAAIIGAYAYRSAKIRRLSQDRTPIRITLELLGVAVVLFLWLGVHDFKLKLATDPFPYFVVPVWSLTAYTIMFLKALNTPPPPKDDPAQAFE